MIQNNRTSDKRAEKLCELGTYRTESSRLQFEAMFVWRTPLLSENPTKSVAIVESEKSALIATHYMPEFIWLATGGNAWVL